MFSNDDFPEPEAPRTVTNSPCAISKFTSCNAWTAAPLPRWCVFDRFRTSIISSSREQYIVVGVETLFDFAPRAVPLTHGDRALLGCAVTGDQHKRLVAFFM